MDRTDEMIDVIGVMQELAEEVQRSHALESMLADKVAVLFSDEDTVLNRVDMIYEIYCLILISDAHIDFIKICRYLKKKGVNLFSQSAYERICLLHSSKLVNPLMEKLREASKLAAKMNMQLNVSDILAASLILINRLRSCFG